MTQGVRPNGQFCWIDMLTPNPTEARAFFAAPLGWTYGEILGMGRFCGLQSQQGVMFYVLGYRS